MRGQLNEIRSGAGDTHTLALAAKRQADKAETISSSLEKAVTDMDAANSDARNSLRATVNQFHLDQRAWVIERGVSSLPKAGKPWDIEVWFYNTGKTPARNVLTSCNFMPALNRDFTPKKEYPPGWPNFIAPNQQIYCTLSPSNGLPVNETLMKIIGAGRIVPIVYG